ncbi:hypothetical protein [Microbacterium hydrocarbonoxydans]|uniref:hypothetical protein n=1 Tax=Microbacterium hydrocarbonoxydans TaxID=273678 RepID=UPI0007BC13E8|nr:hypothetical protein [Microbacterium hydrocarbonoxydans]GAT73544.1 KLTH0C09240p [Microbacterium sp. HM58-2]
MSDADPIEEQKPVADLREQERPDLDEPDDPESPVTASTALDGAEADPADVVDQREEVPLDDDRREE